MKKRFIAGAHCPKCNELDSLMLAEDADIKHFECVECGYIEAMETTAKKPEKKKTQKHDNLIQWVSIDGDEES